MELEIPCDLGRARAFLGLENYDNLRGVRGENLRIHRAEKIVENVPLSRAFLFLFFSPLNYIPIRDDIPLRASVTLLL